MSDDIKVGSIVRLKSGSDKMTVAAIKGIAYSNQIATCWRYENGLFFQSSLPVTTLKLDDGYCSTCDSYHDPIHHKLKWHDTVGWVPFKGGITA